MKCHFSVMRFGDKWVLYLFKNRRAYKNFKPYKEYVVFKDGSGTHKAWFMRRAPWVRVPDKFDAALRAWDALRVKGENE